MRIITRPDFDGVVCAALLLEVEQIDEPIHWVEPGDMQKGLVAVRPGDIIANLPYHENCSLWFDHHFTNEIKQPYKGLFKEAPSAARIIFEYYQPRLKRFANLVEATDRIDAADLTLDEVEHPEKYPTVLLSMTISNQHAPDDAYWNRLVEKLRSQSVEQIVGDANIKARCEAVIEENRIYREQLEKNTRLIDHVAVTDFRSSEKAPIGNRFLVYSMFQEANVHVRIRYDTRYPGRIIVNVGHSIFNRTCNVNVGLMLSGFEGGGHPGAGSCTFDADLADAYIPRIIQILRDNKPNS